MFRLDINLETDIPSKKKYSFGSTFSRRANGPDESASDEFCLKRKVLIGTGAGLIQRRFPLNSNNEKEKHSQKLVSIQ